VALFVSVSTVHMALRQFAQEVVLVHVTRLRSVVIANRDCTGWLATGFVVTVIQAGCNAATELPLRTLHCVHV